MPDIRKYSKIGEYAIKLEYEGKYEEALTYHEMDIEQKTAPYDVRKDMGRIYNKMGRFEEAIKNFDLVLAMNNTHSECLFGKGISNLGLFNWTGAYNFFSKSSKLDETNANSWYYMAVIFKNFGQDNQSKLNFEKFLEYDNEEFLLERKCYKFGIIFEQSKNELFGFKKKINVIAFKNELKSLNLDSYEIKYDLHCLPYDMLVEKILSLRRNRYENTIKEIIRDELREMNLENHSIENMFELESLDSLKGKIISLKGSNPFPPFENSLNIPYYVATLNDHVNRYIKRNHMIAPNVSKFNILADIIVQNSNNRNHFNMHNTRRLNLITIHANKSRAKKYFRFGKKLINEKNEKGISFLEEALNVYPKEDMMRYNIKFYLATVLSKFGYLKRAFHYYVDLKNSGLNLENFDVFLLNFANICYDLGYYYDAIEYYDKFLRFNPDCEVVKILKNSAKKTQFKRVDLKCQK